MVKKTDDKKPANPIIKKRRPASMPTPAPAPAPAGAPPRNETTAPSQNMPSQGNQGDTFREGSFQSGNLNPDDMLDPDDFEMGPRKPFSDTITSPSKSIFKPDKGGYNSKYDGTFNDFTDGVIFNPSEPPMGFDSEWVRFLNQLSADETVKSLADYIRIAPLTRRAKYKLMIYIKTLLDREFTMSNILDQNDMVSVNLDKLLIDADLTLGLTRFDLSPEFQQIINLVRIKFGIKSRRSLFGFERINVNTQRSVNSDESGGNSGGGMEVRKSIQSRIKDLFQSD